MRILTRCTMLAMAAGLPAAQSLGAQDPPPPQAQQQPPVHTVVRGDNLWDLAQRYLGNAFLWPEIYRLNRDVVEDPHWIYPGEVLRLPGEAPPVVSQTPSGQQIPAPVAPTLPAAPAAAPGLPPPLDPSERTVFSPDISTVVAAGPPAGIAAVIYNVQPKPTVRAGEVLVAPYVDREGGPRGFGRILKSGDIAGVAEASLRSNFQAYDRILISPPVGYVAPEGERYLAFKLGPVIEDQGQIIIPTGIVEVTRAARSGTAAVAKVVRAFNELSSTDRLIPLDTAGVGTTVRPERVTNGPSTLIRWIYLEPVLPSVQNFIVLATSSRSGVRMGDEFMVFKPSPKLEEGEDLRDPEILIARAQVVRSTPYGVTAVILGQGQPAIKEGMSARVSAKMP